MRDLFPKELMDELVASCKNDISLLKNKCQDLIYDKNFAGTKPYINIIKDAFNNWDKGQCKFYVMLKEFMKFYDEIMKNHLLESLDKVAYYQKDIREFFCIGDDTKIESFLQFLVDLSARHTKVVDRMIHNHISKQKKALKPSLSGKSLMTDPKTAGRRS